MSSNYLENAFRELDILSEEAFGLTDDGIQGLRDLREKDVENDDTIDVIDPEATTEDELQDDYVGKVILECPVCHSFTFNDREDIEIDKNTELANPNQECLYCYSLGGFKIVGQVSPFDAETENEETVETENVGANVKGKHKIDVSVDCKDSECEISDKDIKSALDEAFGKDGWSSCEMSESAPYSMKVNNGDEMLGEYYYVENKLVKALPESLTVTAQDDGTIVTSDDNTTVTISKGVVASETDSELEPEVEEVVEKTTEESTSDKSADKEQTVTELSDSDKEEIENTEVQECVSPNIVEKQLTHFEENAFNDIGTKFLRKTYENVNSFNTTGVYADDTTVIVEGLISFNSGKSKKTKFKFEAKDITRNGKARFIGENLGISQAHKAFTVSGHLSSGKFVAESLNYNYVAKSADGRSSRVYGTVSIRK